MASSSMENFISFTPISRAGIDACISQGTALVTTAPLVHPRGSPDYGPMDKDVSKSPWSWNPMKSKGQVCFYLVVLKPPKSEAARI